MNTRTAPTTPRDSAIFPSYFRRVFETPRIRFGGEKVAPNLFGGYDLRQSGGKLVRCEASGETECRVVQEGRGN